MTRFKKSHREIAGAEDRVLAKITLDVNRPIPEAGPEASKALGGLGMVEFEGSLSPRKAREIWDIINRDDDDEPRS